MRISSLGTPASSPITVPPNGLSVNKFHDVFDMKRGPPFLVIPIQSAG